MARHIYACHLRWSDMDAFGHVNNVEYVRYLEEARVDFIWRLAPGEGSDAFTGGVVVARHEIDYLKPLVHRHEPVTIETWVTKISAAYLDMAYEVKDEEHVYARAATTIVPYDLELGRPRRVTREEEEFLQKYLEPGKPAKSAKAAKPASGSVGKQDRQPEGAVVG